MSIRGTAAIVGIGETEVGNVPHLSCTQLYVNAIKQAVDDAGISFSEVDGLITGNSRFEPYLYHAEMIAEYLGITPGFCLTVGTGGSTSNSVIQQAVAMIQAGVCNNVVIAKADNLLSGAGREATIESMATIGHPQFEHPYGTLIPALYALLAQRYMHESGVTPEQVAHVAVVNRYHASLNPAAQYREPISVETVLNSRLIADPLHLLECAPISDAGAAIVITSAGRARSMRQKPVYVLGVGESHVFEHVSQAPNLARTGAVESGRAAFAMAGVSHKDIDVAMIYDAFAFIVPMQLEDLGFFPRGEAAANIAAGKTRIDGELPVNTHGGLLSHSHAGRPSALLLVTEAVKQLRGVLGPRQKAGARTALVHGEGGILASHCTAILSTEV